MEMVDFLYVPAISNSVFDHPYLRPFLHSTLVEWFFDWYSSTASAEVLVAVHKDWAGRRISAIASARGFPVWESPVLSQGRAFAQLARHSGAGNLAVVSPMVALAPTDLLARMRRHHTTECNAFTEVIGLPRSFAAEIYSAELIHVLADMMSRYGGTDLATIARVLIATHERTEQESTIELKATPFDAASSYGVDLLTLPASVDPLASTFAGKTMYGLVERALREAEGDTPPVSVLQILHSIKSRWSKEMCREYRNCLPLIRPEERAPRIKAARVAYVSSASGFSGAEQALCTLAENIDSSRYEAHALIGLEGHLTERLRHAGVKTRCPGHTFDLPTLANCAFLYRALSEMAPEIIHLNGFGGSAPLIAAAFLGVPVIQHVRVPEVSELAESVHIADRIIAVSEFVRGRIVSAGVDPSKVAVIYDGVDVRRFTPREISKAQSRAELGLPERAKVILMIARFARSKRHSTLLEAICHIKASVPDLLALFVGEPLGGDFEYYDSIRQEVSRRGLQDVVKFLDFQVDVRRVEAAADVQVLCSIDEPFANCILESMALGVPVIITERGGLREVIEDGLNGYIVRDGDALSVARHLEVLLSDPHVAERIGKAGRQLMESSLTAEMCARQVMDVYDDIILAQKAN